MSNYNVLSDETTKKIEQMQELGKPSEFAFKNEDVIRRNNIAKDTPSIWRPSFAQDIDKILHCP